MGERGGGGLRIDGVRGGVTAWLEARCQLMKVLDFQAVNGEAGSGTGSRDRLRLGGSSISLLVFHQAWGLGCLRQGAIVPVSC